MVEKKLNSWEEFCEVLRNLRQEPEAPEAKFLFRGQKNAKWNLGTTLERFGRVQMRFDDYYKVICRIQPEIESLDYGRWTLQKPSEFTQSLDQHKVTGMNLLMPEAYAYMSHLRHHSFPSPLLDWTMSEYIAAFFAFQKKDDENEAAIYVYRGKPDSWNYDRPNIVTLGPYVRTHNRHFRQQSRYTLCLQGTESECRFQSHESVFAESNPLSGSQVALWKFTLPAAERSKVLKLLDAHNLNAFSLFGSQESLLETLAVRKLDLGAAREPA